MPTSLPGAYLEDTGHRWRCSHSAAYFRSPAKIREKMSHNSGNCALAKRHVNWAKLAETRSAFSPNSHRRPNLGSRPRRAARRPPAPAARFPRGGGGGGGSSVVRPPSTIVSLVTSCSLPVPWCNVSLGDSIVTKTIEQGFERGWMLLKIHTGNFPSPLILLYSSELYSSNFSCLCQSQKNSYIFL
jgi:hypothetical protein